MRDDIRWKRITPKWTVKTIIFLDLHRHFFSCKQSSQRIDPLHSAQLIHLSSILETNFAPLLHRLARTRNRRKVSAAIDVSPRASDPRDRAPVDELYDALSRVPADLRIPWVLHRVEHLSLPETAQACEVSLATVKRRIAEAEERLERRLGGRTP